MGRIHFVTVVLLATMLAGCTTPQTVESLPPAPRTGSWAEYEVVGTDTLGALGRACAGERPENLLPPFSSEQPLMVRSEVGIPQPIVGAAGQEQVATPIHHWATNGPTPILLHREFLDSDGGTLAFTDCFEHDMGGTTVVEPIISYTAGYPDLLGALLPHGGKYGEGRLTVPILAPRHAQLAPHSHLDFAVERTATRLTLDYSGPYHAGPFYDGMRATYTMDCPFPESILRLRGEAITVSWSRIACGDGEGPRLSYVDAGRITDANPSLVEVSIPDWMESAGAPKGGAPELAHAVSHIRASVEYQLACLEPCNPRAAMFSQRIDTGQLISQWSITFSRGTNWTTFVADYDAATPTIFEGRTVVTVADFPPADGRGWILDVPAAAGIASLADPEMPLMVAFLPRADKPWSTVEGGAGIVAMMSQMELDNRASGVWATLITLPTVWELKSGGYPNFVRNTADLAAQPGP